MIPIYSDFDKKKYDNTVNLESGETILLPDNTLAQFSGKKHSAGGIDTILPGEGTKIFASAIQLPKEIISVILDKQKSKVSKMSPAQLTKMFPTKNYLDILENSEDPYRKETAMLMLNKNLAKLETVFAAQEQYKDYKGIQDGKLLKDQGMKPEYKTGGYYQAAGEVPINMPFINFWPKDNNPETPTQELLWDVPENYENWKRDSRGVTLPEYGKEVFGQYQKLYGIDAQGNRMTDPKSIQRRIALGVQHGGNQWDKTFQDKYATVMFNPKTGEYVNLSKRDFVDTPFKQANYKELDKLPTTDPTQLMNLGWDLMTPVTSENKQWAVRTAKRMGIPEKTMLENSWLNPGEYDDLYRRITTTVNSPGSGPEGMPLVDEPVIPANPQIDAPKADTPVPKTTTPYSPTQIKDIPKNVYQQNVLGLLGDLIGVRAMAPFRPTPQGIANQVRPEYTSSIPSLQALSLASKNSQNLGNSIYSDAATADMYSKFDLGQLNAANSRVSNDTQRYNTEQIVNMTNQNRTAASEIGYENSRNTLMAREDTDRTRQNIINSLRDTNNSYQMDYLWPQEMLKQTSRYYPESKGRFLNNTLDFKINPNYSNQFTKNWLSPGSEGMTIEDAHTNWESAKNQQDTESMEYWQAIALELLKNRNK